MYLTSCRSVHLNNICSNLNLSTSNSELQTRRSAYDILIFIVMVNWKFQMDLQLSVSDSIEEIYSLFSYIVVSFAYVSFAASLSGSSHASFRHLQNCACKQKVRADIKVTYVRNFSL
jgi:hypothetical protein